MNPNIEFHINLDSRFRLVWDGSVSSTNHTPESAVERLAIVAREWREQGVLVDAPLPMPFPNCRYCLYISCKRPGGGFMEMKMEHIT